MRRISKLLWLFPINNEVRESHSISKIIILPALLCQLILTVFSNTHCQNNSSDGRWGFLMEP
jgi:hypothetical protein